VTLVPIHADFRHRDGDRRGEDREIELLRHRIGELNRNRRNQPAARGRARDAVEARQRQRHVPCGAGLAERVIDHAGHAAVDRADGVGQGANQSLQ
jgi:hypothetical protein